MCIYLIPMITYESLKHFVLKFSASGKETEVNQGLDNLFDAMQFKTGGAGIWTRIFISRLCALPDLLCDFAQEITSMGELYKWATERCPFTFNSLSISFEFYFYKACP